MCGRTCCTLPPDLLPYACTTVTGRTSGKAALPKWHQPSEQRSKSKERNDNYCYTPSTNIAPTSFTPVIISRSSADSYSSTKQYKDEDSSFVLQSMMWGLIPPWHRSDSPKGHGLTTNNARIENIRQSKLYRPVVESKRRCVVICDGFYEWKTFSDKTKQPYLIYAKQVDKTIKQPESSLNESGNNSSTIKIQTHEKLSNNWNQEDGWIGQKPLFMAAIYSKWNPTGSTSSNCANSLDPIYSYTVITRESGKTMGWLHDRMPLFLQDVDAVRMWLNPNVSGFEAVEALNANQNEGQLSWHPVSPSVGNIRNQDEGLMLKVEISSCRKTKLDNQGTKKSASLMMNWLISQPKKVKAVKSEDTFTTLSAIEKNISLHVRSEVGSTEKGNSVQNKKMKMDT